MTELSILLKATLVVTLAFAGLRLTRRASASVRALLLASTFGVLLALPVTTMTAPPIAVPVPLVGATPAARPAATDIRLPIAAAPAAAVTAVSAPATPSRPQLPSVATALRGVWLAFVVLFGVPVIRALRRPRVLRHGAQTWPGGDALLRSLAADFRMHRRIDVVLRDDVASPMTCGLIRPLIVFPTDAQEWVEADVRRALTHEMEHVERGDWTVHLLARTACAMYWFHPLVWLAWRRFRIESERACDDAVVRSAERTSYAEQLVAMAQRIVGHPRTQELSMAGRSDLGTRVSAVLDGNVRRGRAGVAVRTAIVAAGLLLLLALSPLQAVGRAQVAGAAFDRSAQTQIDLPESESAAVSGYLYDPFGNPLDGIELNMELFEYPPRRYPGRAVTDQTGRFEFRKLPPGHYALTAPTTELVPSAQLMLSAGDQVEHDIHMKFEPLVGRFTVCAECVVRTDNYVLPDSLAREFERDRDWARNQPITGPQPVGGWEAHMPTIPEYPEDLKQKKLEGIVVVEGVIGTDGFRTRMHVVAASHPDLAAAALALLADEQWEPARVRGVPMEVPFREQIEYMLRPRER